MKNNLRAYAMTSVLVLAVLACSFGIQAPVSQPSAEATQAISPDLATLPAGTQAQTDISCLMGYWEVEPDSLKNAANSIIMIPSLYILSVGPSILFAFYTVSEPSPSPYHMDVWYTDVLISANIQSAGQALPQQLDLHLDGVFTADLYSYTPGEITYIPISGETQLQVRDVWLNGEPLTDSPIDLSDWTDEGHAGDLHYECLGGGRISLLSPVAGQPVYLQATTPSTQISP
jgi:hypothetical protein